MTKLPVTFMFSSVDAVLDLATLLEDLAQAEDTVQYDRGDEASADASELKIKTAYEWAQCFRDFVRDKTAQ